MASLIPGFEYDIFISYRQKDNKGDMWVSEFVEGLKTELESTFKEEISVYFDINPHDGLLETHDVDESLKEKLKCLIFIPIISRTYCDPKSFAWEHEFKAFVELASQDQFGLKVKLPGGNVASRVLPIRIHDLDKGDIKLCESVLGGVLRGIEFIYKEPGVNRPLKPDDDENKNLNTTKYRNEINKVANAIADVLNSLTESEPSVDETITEPAIIDEKISTRKPLKKKPREIPSVSLLYRLRNLTTLNLRTWRIIALVFIIVSVGSIWFGLVKTPPPPDRAEHRYDIPLTNYPGNYGRTLTISPDGEHLVYQMNGELNLIQLNSDAPSQPISGTYNYGKPLFSPDGTEICFSAWAEYKIKKTPLTGGNPIVLCDIAGEINDGKWYKDEIIYAVRGAIYRVPDAGGTPELLYPLIISDNDPWIWHPQLLPDKKTLLFSQKLEDTGWHLMTWKLKSKERPAVLVEGGMDGRYLNSGHIVYCLNSRLYICKFNSKTNRIVSKPKIIATGPVMKGLYDQGVYQFDFSDNGILVYCEHQETPLRNIVWVDESGVVSEPITKEAKLYGIQLISSDAKYIVVTVISESGDYLETIDTETGINQLFVENACFPMWSADNSSIYYRSTITGNQVYQKSLDEPVNASGDLLFELDGVTNIGPYSISSDGRYLFFDANFSIGSNWEIGYYDIINNKVEILVHYNTEGNDSRPMISPDGKWIAYQSNKDGEFEIYVAPFPGPGREEKVTSGNYNGQYSLVWSPDMTALYYSTVVNTNYVLWKIKVQASETNFSHEPAQPFFNGGDRFQEMEKIGIHPDGDRFLLLQKEFADQEFIEPRIKVIVNWEQELENN